MKEPVDHIVRPRLPWRSPKEPAITECGYDASKVKHLTREQYFVRVREMGGQRAALFTCMTCAQTAGRWQAWDQDPRNAVEREIVWESAHWHKDRGTRLRDELEAIAVLIAAHPEEFARFVEDIVQRREWLKRKAEREGTPVPTPRRRL